MSTVTRPMPETNPPDHTATSRNVSIPPRDFKRMVFSAFNVVYVTAMLPNLSPPPDYVNSEAPGTTPRNIQISINLLTPNVNYSSLTAPLTSKVAFYIFIQQI